MIQHPPLSLELGEVRVGLLDLDLFVYGLPLQREVLACPDKHMGGQADFKRSFGAPVKGHGHRAISMGSMMDMSMIASASCKAILFIGLNS